MDAGFETRPIARWYYPAAIAALLFMLLGCAVFLLDVSTDPATMLIDQRAAHDAQPLWLMIVYGVAVWAGALGALLLLLRRRIAERLLLLSFVAVSIWLAGLLLVPRLRDLLGTDDIAVAIVVTILTWTIYWFARNSRRRGWLR
jgi:putative Mn2+ efflux pump MntP